MCFNALISNTDDHPRNHAVIAMYQDWKLSPAYDLTPSMPVSTERRDLALSCGDMGRYAHADNLLSQHGRFLLGPDEAKYIIDMMEETIKNRWYEIARREGVSEKDGEKISSAFAYPGFRQDLAHMYQGNCLFVHRRTPPAHCIDESMAPPLRTTRISSRSFGTWCGTGASPGRRA